MASADAPALLVDGRRAVAVAAADRGLAYGDGLFETLRSVQGRFPLWPLHRQRLARGGRRLALALPDPAVILRELECVAAGGDGVVKLILTRGDGRGYRPQSGAVRRIVQRWPLPPLAPETRARGLRLRWCRLRLATQPALAGIKHLNRLEQVLARGEWRDAAIDEGLCRDDQGHVVCATAANVFAVIDGVLVTPLLDRCGVAGVARAWLLRAARRQRIAVQERRLHPDELDAAQEVFLSNAVRGVMPVRALGRRRWQPGPVARALGYTLAAVGIGLHLDPPPA